MSVEPLTDRVPDDELLRQTAAGSQPAFAELFRRLHPLVFRFALHMTGSISTADDVVQDVFLIVMSDAARYEAGRGAVAAWLCGIARNCVRQRLERDRRLAPLDLAGNQEPASDDGGPTDPLSGLLRAERIESVRRAVDTLPVRYREALVLCDLQEMTYEDAAQALECPIGTVRSRLHRARAMLAAKFLAAGRSGQAMRSEAAAGDPTAAAGATIGEDAAEADVGEQAREAGQAHDGAKGCYA
jgi:RNA polymerase sigma-70 factor (ECF subfamily)